MIGLLIQIILTIIVWNRGWKWLSLIPIGSGFVLGLLIGMIGGSLGYTTEDLGWAAIFDVLIYVALIIMCIKPKRKKITEEDKKIVL